MKRTRQYALLAAVVLMSALPVFAQNVNVNSRIFRDGNAWVEEITGAATSPGVLRLNTDMGNINIQGGPQKDIQFTVRKRVYSGSEEAARRDLANFRVSTLRRTDALALEGHAEGHMRRMSVEYQVQVPRDLQQVKAETDGGNISIRNLAGKVNADSGGGNITLADVAGPISGETGGGSIDVTNSSNLLNLSTGGGSISISTSKGKVKASTGGGSITVTNASDDVTLDTGGGSVRVDHSGELHCTTGGGSIHVGDVSGLAKLETGGGSIRLASARGPVTASTGGGSIELYKLMQGAKAETGAGPITAEFLGFNSDSSLQTSVGDVIVYLSPQAKVTIQATLDMANGHQIRSDFPDLKISGDGGGYGPKNYYAQGALNGGGPVLRVRTMSGNIEFRRAR